MLASGPVEQGFESTWGRVLALFFLCLFFAYTKIHTIFFVVVIFGILVWSNSVRTAAVVVIMYLFTAVPHVLYSSTINNALFTAVGRQMGGFEPSLPCFCVFFSFFFLDG